MQIVNEARVNFGYCLSENLPFVWITAYSNCVKTIVINDIIDIKIFVDKREAVIYDILKYRVVLKNTSEIDVENLSLKDEYSNYTEFIKNSISIEGNEKHCVILDDFIKIDRVEANKSVEIKFKMLVRPGAVCHKIKNTITVDFDYVYDVFSRPKRITVISNEVDTYICDKLFKEIIINSIIKSYLKDIERVKAKAKVNICEKKIVAAPINCTSEHEEKDLCKLIIIGTIEYDIEGKIKKHKHKCKSISAIDAFSCFMLVPYGIQYFNETDGINIVIENVGANIVGRKKMLASSMIIVKIT